MTHAFFAAMLIAAPLAAQTTQAVKADTNWNTLDHRHPVVRRIKPGDIVITKTLDANSYKPGSARPNRQNLLLWDLDLAKHMMADGEPTGAGIETSMDAEFSVELKKGARLTNPRVENSDYMISVGSQREFVSTLGYALKVATTDMVRWLAEDFKLEPWAAHLMIDAVGEYEVVTVAGSMALKVPKKHLTR